MQKHVIRSCRSRQELSNEYLLAKICFDTAENVPLKVVCVCVRKMSKEVSKDCNILLRLYYTSRPMLFTVCACQELVYMMLFVPSDFFPRGALNIADVCDTDNFVGS